MNVYFLEYLPDIFIVIALGVLSFFLLFRHLSLESLDAIKDKEKVSKLQINCLAIAMLLLTIALIYLLLRAIISTIYSEPDFALIYAVFIFGGAILFSIGIMYLGLRQIMKRRKREMIK